MTPKQQIRALLDQLPEDSTFQEIQNHLNSYGGLRPLSRHRADSNGSCGGGRFADERTSCDGARAYAVWQDMVRI